jgi:hypothetical protein
MRYIHEQREPLVACKISHIALKYLSLIISHKIFFPDISHSSTLFTQIRVFAKMPHP